jgi:heat shock protein HslJ
VVHRFVNVWPGERCERARAAAALPNTYWRIATLAGEPVGAVEGRREPHLILRAGGGQGTTYSATVGCNQLAGVYSPAGEEIRFSPGATTLLPCPPPLDELEASLVAVLSNTARWRITGNTLEFFDVAGKSLALFEAVYF